MNKHKNVIYAAGYIDGDGSFFCKKQLDKRDNSFYYHYGVKISSTNSEIIHFFKNEFGGSVYKRIKTGNHNPVFELNIQGAKSRSFIESIISYLVQRKNEALLVYNFINVPHNERDKIVDQLRELKKSDFIQESDKQKILERRNSIEPSEADFIYLAGFIDAECCMTIRQQKSPILFFTETKRPMFFWLAERFGGNVFFLRRNFPRRNKFQWICMGKSMYKILPVLSRHLRYKKRVCEKLMEFIKTIKTTKKLSPEVIEKRKAIVDDIHKFNHRGITSL